MVTPSPQPVLNPTYRFESAMTPPSNIPVSTARTVSWGTRSPRYTSASHFRAARVSSDSPTAGDPGSWEVTVSPFRGGCRRERCLEVWSPRSACNAAMLLWRARVFAKEVVLLPRVAGEIVELEAAVIAECDELLAVVIDERPSAIVVGIFGEVADDGASRQISRRVDLGPGSPRASSL